MNIESESTPLESFTPFPIPSSQRILYALFVTVLPIFSFSMVHVMKPEWQSGKLSDYMILFLFPEAALFIFPLLAYSIICYLLLLINPSRFASLFLIRFGVYSGVLLALHFNVAVLLSLELSPWLVFLFIAWISPLLFSRIYPWAIKKWNLQWLGWILAGIVLLLALTSMVISRNIFSPFFTFLVLLVLVAPFWSFLLSAQAAIWLIKNHESKLTLFRGFGMIAWITVYIGALRFNILKMYELYAALPPQPPDCYIATAAAKGHPRIVGSQVIHLSNGKQMQVNSQLQHLKSVELALMAISPRSHKSIRSVYDVIGKKMARYIQNPLLADVAFLLLVPVEWISIFIVRLFIPEIEMISKKIYRS